MNFAELTKQRRSIRAFKDQIPDRAAINRILDAANRAPSAGNLQAYEIFLVTDSATRRLLATASHEQDFLSSAPVVLVFCADPARNVERYRERGTTLYCIQDATIACTFAMLAATEEKLSTVWVGAFNEQRVLEALGNPPGLRPVAILPIGIGAEAPRITRRRPVENLVHRVE
ncbi:MAG: nitroreductase family protein [Acidobacteriota bacterium]|nr:MAG: nitroreductase family protein [Acidobacteriota bacterium]